MKQITKKLTVVLLLLLSVSFCLFADSTPFLFQISHAINVTSAYYFEFWKYRTGEAVPNATISYSSAGDYGLATLGIIYNANTTVSRMDIEISDLVYSEDETKFLDFTLSIFKPNDTTVIPFTPSPNSTHGAGSANLFTNKQFVKYDVNQTWNRDEIADFRIAIDDTNAEIGTFSGYLKFIVTT